MAAAVQGLSWDVIQTLAVAYDLHPLSVEDIVHVPQRIKADYYQVSRNCAALVRRSTALHPVSSSRLHSSVCKYPREAHIPV